MESIYINLKKYSNKIVHMLIFLYVVKENSGRSCFQTMILYKMTIIFNPEGVIE